MDASQAMTAAMQSPAGAPATDARITTLRRASAATLVATVWIWHARASGDYDPTALALLAAVVVGCLGFGAVIAHGLRRLVPRSPGLAFEFLLGFFFANTMLFVLALASPLGIVVDAALLGLPGVALALVASRRRWRGAATFEAEAGSLACIVATAIFATVWVGDQQPIMTALSDRVVFDVWSDVYIHVREISAFAQSHGAASLTDIKLAGVQAPAYHFASYMGSALMNAATGTVAMDTYGGLMLPLGLLLTGLAAYVLVAVALRTTWPAVLASAVLMAAPDAYQQGFGILYLSFSFMSQVNLGMLYGLACVALAWVLMMEACRAHRVTGLALAYAMFAACVTYKAHLVVANALILMLYPCVFFGRFRRRRRVLAAITVTVLFFAVARISQLSPRVPTLRFDGSGLGDYVDILMGGFRRGGWKNLFTWVYYDHAWPRAIKGVLAGVLIAVASFGIWTGLAPLVLWRSRQRVERQTIAFVLLVAVNYQAMSMLLALDERGIGSREEFLNRPHAWAWFVVVSMTVGIAAFLAWGARRPPVRARWGAVPVFALLLLAVRVDGRDLQTAPEWPMHTTYAEFNSAPTCLWRAAVALRERSSPRDVFVDSALDPRVFVTAVSERQSYLSAERFGGHDDVVRARTAEVRTVLGRTDAASLEAWAADRRVDWLLLQPEAAAGWDAGFLNRAVFRCDDYRVIRLSRGDHAG